MSLGPAEILVVLVVALIVFGPKRLPEVGRQIGGAMRELRRMQDNVRAEIDNVLHPDVAPSEVAAPEDVDHAALPPATAPGPGTNDEITGGSDDPFGGPPGSFL